MMMLPTPTAPYTPPTRALRAVGCLLAFAALLAPALAAAQEGEGGDASPEIKIKTAEGQPAPEATPEVTPTPDTTAAGQEVAGQEGNADYDLRVRELEEKVNDLKEKIFRSKSRLVLLKETVLRGSLSGSKAVLVHRNEMGSSFELDQVVYSLDGNQIFNERNESGELDDKERIEIFNGAIVPGNHNLSLMLVYKGNTFGAFAYLQGYKFTIRSSYTFAAEEGKTTQVNIIGYEKGGITTAMEDRPDVKYEIEFIEDTTEADAGSAQNTPRN